MSQGAKTTFSSSVSVFWLIDSIFKACGNGSIRQALGWCVASVVILRIWYKSEARRLRGKWHCCLERTCHEHQAG